MAELSGQQVLVTGGAGFVGRSVVRALAQQRARVTVVDLQPFPDGDVRSVVGEITDPATREMLLSGYAGAYGMSTCALRLTNVYGQGMTHKDSLVARLMFSKETATT